MLQREADVCARVRALRMVRIGTMVMMVNMMGIMLAIWCFCPKSYDRGRMWYHIIWEPWNGDVYASLGRPPELWASRGNLAGVLWILSAEATHCLFWIPPANILHPELSLFVTLALRGPSSRHWKTTSLPGDDVGWRRWLWVTCLVWYQLAGVDDIRWETIWKQTTHPLLLFAGQGRLSGWAQRQNYSQP